MEILVGLLGAAATFIGGLLALVVLLIRRGNGNHNPNIGILDEKLNQILLLLTKIEAALQNAPCGQQRRE